MLSDAQKGFYQYLSEITADSSNISTREFSKVANFIVTQQMLSSIHFNYKKLSLIYLHFLLNVVITMHALYSTVMHHLYQTVTSPFYM